MLTISTQNTSRELFAHVDMHCWEQFEYGVAMTSRLLKIIGLFSKELYKRDYILQKRPIIFRSLLMVGTPY